jgi:hypothetical protein
MAVDIVDQPAPPPMSIQRNKTTVTAVYRGEATAMLVTK